MPVFTRHEIDTMGFKAARDFKEGSSLHTSIVKMAKDNSMNPEQIKRLVESANTTALASPTFALRASRTSPFFSLVTAMSIKLKNLLES